MVLDWFRFFPEMKESFCYLLKRAGPNQIFLINTAEGVGKEERNFPEF